jgi:penicillin-binding protein 1C
MKTEITRRRILRRVIRGALLLTIAFMVLAVAAWLALPLVPLPAALRQSQISQWEFVDRNGAPLRTVNQDGGPFVERVAYPDLPESLVRATLAAEDIRFWRHRGMDCRATLRAAWQFISHGRIISGGSTITQQLIKLAQPRPRTLRTKLIEAAQALRLEQVWDKRRILTEYLNRLDYGNFNRGCSAAAGFYFAKPLRDLSPAECAFLAALPQAPSRLNPLTHFDRGVKRQQWVLHRMHLAGWLDEQSVQRAAREPLRLAKPQRLFEAPHFMDLVLSSITARPDSPAMTGNSHDVAVTIDLGLNRFAQATLRSHLSQLQRQHVSNGAIVILDNRSSEIVTLIGSDDYFAPDAGQVNGAWAPRSAGSTFKPFTYLLALEQGASPASVVADVPTEFATATGLFVPANYNRHCYGPMRYRMALANSLNISAVKVLNSIGGPEPLLKLLQECGLTTLDHPPEYYGLGLTIGNAEARLLELANAYACLARLGEYRPFRLFKSDRGSLAGPSRRVFDPAAAYLIADILSDNAARALAFGAESALRFDFPVACKTGTSSDFRDNWAFGYTPEFTVGVWVGNFDGSPMQQVSGVTGAGPILHDLFEHLHSRFGTTWYAIPPNIVECPVHPITGKRLKSNAPFNDDFVLDKFVAGNLPPEASPSDYAVGHDLNPNNPKPVPLGSEYAAWFATSDNGLGARAVLAPDNDSLRILSPLPGTKIFLDADLPGQGRRLALRAGGSGPRLWRSDSLQFSHEGDNEIALLSAGRHEITVSDPRTGARDQTWIEVRVR